MKSGLCNGPTKVDVGMHDEVIAVRDRLRKGLQKWFTSLRTRQALLDERLARLQVTRPETVRNASSELQAIFSPGGEDTETELRQVSCLIKQETAEIKELVDSIKLLNARSTSLSV
ncbi:unnamed protein product [Echinostoma caproni]|uniref:Uncharacterized protein n=1 Tax=Echinostoma caproni TaxID=27848 RepID=A0A183B1Q2_9TREM|nr:unnamed protein product [Echinostoma caproni]